MDKNLESDFEVIRKILAQFPGATAREIAQHAVSVQIVDSQIGYHKWDKGRVNSTLYKMLVQNLVIKELRDGPRPHWILNQKPEPKLVQPKLKLAPKKPRADTTVALTAITEYQQLIQGRKIQIAIDDSASPNDMYISCDWLEDRIFVAINPNHPYVACQISNDEILLEFLRFLAIDAYTEWRLIMNANNIEFISLIKIRDKSLRDF